MYLLANASIRVSCAGEDTFNYATNLINFSEWFPGVLKIAAEDELLPVEIGKRYRETVAMPFRGRREVLIRVVEADPPGHFATEGELPGLWPRMEIDVKTLAQERCEVRWRMYSRNQSMLARWSLLPLARRLMRTRAAAGLRNLKGILEMRVE